MRKVPRVKLQAYEASGQKFARVMHQPQLLRITSSIANHKWELSFTSLAKFNAYYLIQYYAFLDNEIKYSTVCKHEINTLLHSSFICSFNSSSL
ncbi:hypothetical protein VCRA2113O325_110111 [Vibrio crassostreae]|nr:hypothetical protein VCRA2113O322_110052 [Vibrio crassostreae]CAK1717201.1 hypothetical protein VCRA2113O326_110064 [Vibrio crassostreae]CAK2536023.1 hypothetical protein VCRA2113O321_110064 [Vibrio crassostreae]CAK2538786.1 hypothetical protein VCRA2113O323_110111 [Vibrio crassostreae]CAK2591962.1 hypothetical protein VCRA2113O325_110111 [Vibrio crassostreae]